EVHGLRPVDAHREEEGFALRFDLERAEEFALPAVHLDALVRQHDLGVALDLVRMKRRLSLLDDAEPEVDAAVGAPDDGEPPRQLLGDDLAAETLGEAARREQ